MLFDELIAIDRIIEKWSVSITITRKHYAELLIDSQMEATKMLAMYGGQGRPTLQTTAIW